MTTPAPEKPEDNTTDRRAFHFSTDGWPMGMSNPSFTSGGGSSSILTSGTAAAGGGATGMDSSSIFSLDHLHTSLYASKDEEVLVEKEEALRLVDDDTASSNKKKNSTATKTSQNTTNDDTVSVVSNHSDNNTIIKEDDTPPPSSTFRLKPFWWKGSLKNDRNDDEEEAEEEAEDAACRTNPQEEDDHHHVEERDVALVEDDGNDEDLCVQEYQPEKTTATTTTTVAGTCRRLVAMGKEGIQAARMGCHSYWDRVRGSIETLCSAGVSQNPNGGRFVFGIVASILLCVFCLFCVLLGRMMYTTSTTASFLPSPKNDLRDFILYEKTKNGLSSSSSLGDDVEDLETDSFRVFARSACVKAATLETTRAALWTDLKGVPDDVRTDVVEMAVQEGVTQMSSLQDSKADLVEAGTAFSFMAFWSTAYNPSTTSSPSGTTNQHHHTYETCVMVTGVVLSVAETVAEWTMKQEKYQIGVTPCYCGPLTCAECPVFDTRIVKWPVLERRSLSLKKQKELRKWMIQEAIQSAEHIIATGNNYLPSTNNNIGGNNNDDYNNNDEEAVSTITDQQGSSFAWNPMSNVAWTSPLQDDYVLFGEQPQPPQHESATTDTEQEDDHPTTMKQEL